VKDYAYLIWLGLVAALFAVLWKTGQLLRLRNYVGETREELKKCTWPSRDELKGSTVVVVISTILLGAFTVVLDFVIAWFVQQLI
jgi:preprotein translocase subunit SecE